MRMITIIKNRIWVLIFSILIPLSSIIMWFSVIEVKKILAMRYYDQVKNNVEAYCYDTLRNTLNNAYYITDLKFKDALINHYLLVVKRKNPPIEFPIKFMPYEKKIFILGNVEPDSMLFEFVDFDTTCMGYVHGYIHRFTLSPQLPSYKLIEDHNKFVNDYKKTTDYIIRSKSYKFRTRISEYGIQCGCE
jgi:hypothetical protein